MTWLRKKITWLWNIYIQILHDGWYGKEQK